MRTIHLAALCLLGVAAVAAAAPAPTATAAVGTGVKDRTIEGPADSFPADVGQLYCLSDVRGASGTIAHVWFRGDRELTRIELPVRGERFRTWSAKRVLPGMVGPWRVEVRAADGTVLATAGFAIK